MMKFHLFILLFGLSLAHPDEDSVTREWREYKKTFGKEYNEKEETERLEVFIKNRDFITQHNALYRKGEVSYSLKINQFSDWFSAEFENMMPVIVDRQDEDNNYDSEEEDEAVKEVTNIPTSFSWREEGGVTPIKSQNACGACWAFSAVDALETHNFIKHKKLVTLSIQNVIDCDKKSNGCHGGSPYNAYDYIIASGGIDTEKSYPYEGKQGSCRFFNGTIEAKVLKYTKLPKKESVLRQTLATIGPVSVGIHASLPSFVHYHKGVYYDPQCDNNHHVNHAVVAVGYGVENGTNYFLLKNSWGKHWGDQGYVKINATTHGLCRLTSHMLYPTVA